jgi:hypothetical protein
MTNNHKYISVFACLPCDFLLTTLLGNSSILMMETNEFLQNVGGLTPDYDDTFRR